MLSDFFKYVSYLELMKKDTETNSLEMSGQLRFLSSDIVKHCSPPDWSAGTTEDEFQVFKPSEGAGEHVHPGPVPTRPGLHTNTDVQMFAAKCSVAVMFLIN